MQINLEQLYGKSNIPLEWPTKCHDGKEHITKYDGTTLIVSFETDGWIRCLRCGTVLVKIDEDAGDKDKWTGYETSDVRIVGSNRC